MKLESITIKGISQEELLEFAQGLIDAHARRLAKMKAQVSLAVGSTKLSGGMSYSVFPEYDHYEEGLVGECARELYIRVSKSALNRSIKSIKLSRREYLTVMILLPDSNSEAFTRVAHTIHPKIC